MESLRTAARRGGSGAGHRLGAASYLQRWLILGVLIGVVAGLGAVVFYWMLTHATEWLLVDLGGYTPPRPSGEGGASTSALVFSDFSRPWAIPLVVGGGALASGLLVFTFAPEAEGHGTDAAIAAIHRNPREIAVRAVVVKIIASALTIGSGGSGGREGPTAQISAGFASAAARVLDLRAADGRTAVAVGVGSGIGAIFGAPLGGAVLASSIAYKNDIDARVLIPGFITSVTAYAVFGAVDGFHPLFGYATQGYVFDNAVHLVWFAVIGVVAGIVGIAYSRCFYAVTRMTKRIPGTGRAPRIAKATAGGVLVGLLALAAPQVLGSGYGWAQAALDRDSLMTIPLWLVLVLPAAKILATSLSIGTGGSGGIFGPGMVIGAFTGAAVWRVLETLGAPSVPGNPAVFVVVGMMACFGSIARVPLAVMLMVGEMTGSYTVMVPAMLAVGLAYLIVRQTGDTIYSEQIDSRESEYAARVGSALPLLDRVTVAETMSAPPVLLRVDLDRAASVERLRNAGVGSAPVVDAYGRFVGVLSAPEGTGDAADAGAGVRARPAVLDRSAPTVPLTAHVDEAVRAVPPAGVGQWITVVDAQRRVRGVVTTRDIVRGYRAALVADAERFRGLAESADVANFAVDREAPLAGSPASGPSLPDRVIVLSVLRAGTAVAPAEAGPLAAGDTVTALGPRAGLEELGRRLGGAERPRATT